MSPACALLTLTAATHQPPFSEAEQLRDALRFKLAGYGASQAIHDHSACAVYCDLAFDLDGQQWCFTFGPRKPRLTRLKPD